MIKPILLEKTDFHIFYYPWWGNIETDGAYRHWGDNGHTPADDDISANYYPKEGLYSSHNISLIETQMGYIKRAGVGVIIISWWGQGSFEDLIVSDILDAADAVGIKVGFIMEPYGGITVSSIMADIAYVYEQYGSHPAFYRYSRATKWGTSSLPRGVFYIYDSYLLNNAEWITAVDAIRGTENDAILLTNNNPKSDTTIVNLIHFDGLYNYDILLENGVDFANCGAVMAENNTIWSPSVGPGFIDQRVRDGNPEKSRIDGQMLNDMFGLAYQSSPTFISLVSFNESHEGTQIEPAQIKSIAGFTYKDFEGAYGKTGEAAQFAYIDEVAFWASKRSRRLA